MSYLFTDKQNAEKPLTDAVQVQIEGLDKKLKDLEKTVTAQIKEQRSENKNITYAVLVAAVLILVAVAIEIIIFHTRDQNIVDEYRQKINVIEAQMTSNQNEK